MGSVFKGMSFSSLASHTLTSRRVGCAWRRGAAAGRTSMRGWDGVQGAVHGESDPVMLGPLVPCKAASKSAAVPWCGPSGWPEQDQLDQGAGKDPLQGGRLGVHLPREERAIAGGKSRVQK